MKKTKTKIFIFAIIILIIFIFLHANTNDKYINSEKNKKIDNIILFKEYIIK